MFRAIKCIKRCQDLYGTAYKEADILKNLRHPAIPIIYDIEQDEEHVYIVEEFVEGLSLTELISKEKFNTEKVIEITLKLCDILSYLHSNNTYHLDIKPENIIVDKSSIKLIDYGSASTDSDLKIRMGTKGYAAPEMYGREKIESGSDVYSIGVVMLFMLTGSREYSSIGKVKNDSLRKIICGCLYHTGKERISSFDILARKIKKINQKEFAENVSLRVHVGSVIGHSGSTHCAFMLGNCLRLRGYNTIVCENNDSESFFDIVKANDFIFNKGVFSIDRFKIMPNYHGYVSTDCLMEYDRVVYDFGRITQDNFNDFMSGDMVYLVTGAKPYEIGKLMDFINALHIPISNQNKIHTLINFADSKSYKDIIRKYDIPIPVRVPYETDPFKSKKDWLI